MPHLPSGSVKGQNTGSGTGKLLGETGKSGGRVLYGIGKGLVNIGIRGLVGKQAYDDRKRFGSPTYSHGDIYKEAGAEGVDKIRTDVATGGQTGGLGADCVSRYIGRHGGAGASRSDVANAKKFCGIKE